MAWEFSWRGSLTRIRCIFSNEEDRKRENEADRRKSETEKHRKQQREQVEIAGGLKRRE